MKENELRKELQSLYGDVPPATHVAFMDALVRPRKEGYTVKKTMLTPVLALILALCFGTVAFAATTQVLDWYYENRFENYPAKDRSAILENVAYEIPQTQDENALFNAVVQEYSWVADKGLLIVTMNVAPKDATIELHPMWNLDADGAYVGGDLAETTMDGDDRSEHWLWTEKGFGKVADMMDDPTKALHLVDVKQTLLGKHDSDLTITMDSTDAYRQADGSVQFVMEYRIGETLSNKQIAEYRQWLSEENAEKQIARIEAAREIILNCGGMLDVSIPYFTVAYTEDDEALYVTGQELHWVDVTLDIGDIASDYFE